MTIDTPPPPGPAAPDSGGVPQNVSPGGPMPSSGVTGGLGRSQIHHTTVRQGEFPPPEAMRVYEDILPGAFGRLVKMAEIEQAAQIAQAERAMRYSSQDFRRGQFLGFATTVLAMLGGFACLYVKQPYVASLFLSIPVMAVAKTLVDSGKTPAQRPAPLNRAGSPDES